MICQSDTCSLQLDPQPTEHKGVPGVLHQKRVLGNFKVKNILSVENVLRFLKVIILLLFYFLALELVITMSLLIPESFYGLLKINA